MTLNLVEIDSTLSRFFRLKKERRQELLEDFIDVYGGEIIDNSAKITLMDLATFDCLVDFLKACLSDDRLKLEVKR